MTESRQKVLVIKQLIKTGYKDKHICMITQSNQPYVSKIRHERIHVNTNPTEDEKVEMTEDQKRRLETLEKITKLPDLVTMGDNSQDLIYIHVLKFFMVSKEDVYNLYFHLSKKHFFKLWSTKDVNILDFDSELIGIKRHDYLDLIIDYFIEK